MTDMEKEIFSQSETIENAAFAAENNAKRVAELICNNCKHVIMVARGSSDNACTFFKYYLEIKTGVPVMFFHPSVLTEHKPKFNFVNSVVIGVSQSGQAADCIAVLNEAARQGAATVALTNFPDSPMAKCAKLHICLNVGEEKSVAATKTFTAELLVLKMIADYAAEGKFDISDVKKTVDNALNLKSEVDNAAKFLKNADQLIVLARGATLSIAQELSTKLMETNYLNARYFAISDFYHGPFALVSEKIPFLVIAVDSYSEEDAVNVIKKMKQANAKVVAITAFKSVADLADCVIPLERTDDYAAPFGAVVSGQMLALSMTKLRNLNPDAPRGLNKVTITF